MNVVINGVNGTTHIFVHTFSNDFDCNLVLNNDAEDIHLKPLVFFLFFICFYFISFFFSAFFLFYLVFFFFY